MNFDEKVGLAAKAALISEVEATPKPGLVDQRNNGAHSDMNADTFKKSAGALENYFALFSKYGRMTFDMPETDAFPGARILGLEAEKAMYEATQGVNTHKGAIFSLGLLSVAAGRLHQKRKKIDVNSLCLCAAAFVKGICAYDYANNKEIKTHGDKVYKRYGVTGPRGEAESGFPTLRNVTYPSFVMFEEHGRSENESAVRALLKTMSVIDDTNILNRTDEQTLSYVKEKAEALVYSDISEIEKFDEELIRLNVSPGGSADLLAEALFVRNLIRNENK